VPTLTIAWPPAIAMRFIGKAEPPSVTLRNEHQAFERAYAAGIPIAFGTDAGIYPHGRNADEFEKMVEFGMGETDAIRSATVHTANLFGIAETTGTLEAGKKADIIAVTENPLENIGALKTVDFVMKGGHLAKLNGNMTTALRFDLEHRY
jgi:imidazolonepropionase-like amidohydrolase